MSKHAMTHFLLVEDDDDHAELVALALHDNNVINSLDRVSDGVEALDYMYQRAQFAERRRPDLILLDLNLPRMDGHRFLSLLKEDEKFRAIPVVVLTTSQAEADKAKAYQNHANSYLVKPLDFDKFQSMIRDLRLYWSVWNQRPSEP